MLLDQMVMVAGNEQNLKKILNWEHMYFRFFIFIYFSKKMTNLYDSISDNAVRVNRTDGSKVFFSA